LPVPEMPKCLGDYMIAHYRDGQGFVRTWFDQEKASETSSIFTWTPN